MYTTIYYYKTREKEELEPKQCISTYACDNVRMIEPPSHTATAAFLKVNKVLRSSDYE